MAPSVDHHLHFHCTFRLRSLGSKAIEWAEIPRLARSWVRERLEANGVTVDEDYGRRWLFTGGAWRSKKQPRILVETRGAIGSGTTQRPQHWSLRYEIPDSGIPFRQWRTDVGVSTVDDIEIQVSISTVHWLLPGYIGKEPDTPLPSAPGIVKKLLASRQWRIVSGDQPMSARVFPVVEGKANEFVERLMSPFRGCPLVLVSREFTTGIVLVSSDRLANLLAGAACVYESQSSLIDRELEHLLDQEYRCWNGRVRVYQPHIRKGDAKRHRYFTREDIELQGSSSVEDMLIRGVVRRSQLWLGSSVATIEDVAAKQREDRLALLRMDNTDKELIILYEEEMKELKGQIEQWQEVTDFWKGQAEEAGGREDEMRRLEFEKKQLEARAEHAEHIAAAATAKSSLLESLDDLPSSVLEVIDVVAKTYHDRIVFTDRAKADAKKSKFKDPHIAWRCLRSMATVLHGLHFDESLPLREIVKRYHDSVSFELAVGESESTKNNRRLARQRRGFYNGQERDFSAHVKVGRDPGRLLRVHYYADSEGRLIVIDRCGDHLDVMSTN
jgi:hypothetical protein